MNIILSGVSEGFLDILGVPLARGRNFTHQEHLVAGRDAPFVVVISYRAWNTLFGRDPDILGKIIHIAETPASITIVGVAPPAIDMPRGTDFWFNFRINPQDVAHVFATILRLRPGATLGGLRSASAVGMAGLARTVPSDIGRDYVMRSLVSSLVGDLGPTLLIVLGATGLLLVLACGMARTREIAVRSALGASRGLRDARGRSVRPALGVRRVAVVTWVSTMIPAIRASRLSPVRALRSE
ncbi:MAG TPA: ABC transporter permease [Vicinamibacterales bacterium]|nr:ABC transporter permease [Vicinamibacterales bacterium]